MGLSGGVGIRMRRVARGLRPGAVNGGVSLGLERGCVSAVSMLHLCMLEREVCEWRGGGGKQGMDVPGYLPIDRAGLGSCLRCCSP